VSNQFSAAPSALGYFYQCEVALLELLRRDDPLLELSIELLDDVAFEGEQTALFQAKYQVTPGSLTDGSADLWKTLRVWSEGVKAHPDALLVLVTTSKAQDGSIASLLRRSDGRDAATAHDKLVAYAKSRTSDTLREARQAFLGVDDDVRKDMVSRIVVSDEAPGFSDLGSEFERALRLAAPSDRRLALATRLREWWLARAEGHLVEVALGKHPTIELVEVETKMADLRDQLAADNLPIDFEALPEPTDEEVAGDQRAFVMQLRLISLANARVRTAIYDHNRAFAQRARWLREDLVAIGELATYERRLKDEWQRLWLPETDDELELTEAEASARGRDVYLACDRAVVEPIRPKVAAPHIMRGSMHMLADELRIGWHHDWVARMQALLAEPAT
jgi:hypothetical protein